MMATVASPPRRAYQARRWTIAEFDRLVADGFIREGSRAFLWDGEILEAMSENEPHAQACDALMECLADRLDRAEWAIRHDHPLALREGFLPQPDIAVLRGPRLAYAGRRPMAADAALVVEVADTSYLEDSITMLREYARAGIDQYWIVHINARRVEVYRHPRLVDGLDAYGEPALYSIDAAVPLVLAGGSGQADREFPAISVVDILRGSTG